jgi:hypothetical protein
MFGLILILSFPCRKESEDGDTNEFSSEEEHDRKHVLPKIIGIGLQGVFEIIRECRTTHPGKDLWPI